MMARRGAADGVDGLGPLRRPGPLRQEVEERLRELIIGRTLPPGQHLVETELATRLGVSRGPVREALQSLHRQGWVELRPGRGAFVHRPGEREVDEVFAVRAALESEAAGLAAERITAADVTELRRFCSTGRAAVGKGDEAAVVAANSALHRCIASLSGVQLLCDYITSLDRRVRWFYRPLVHTRGLASWDEHDQLIAALAARDRQEAARVMRAHTERTRTAYRSVVTEEGEPQDASGRRAHREPVR